MQSYTLHTKHRVLYRYYYCYLLNNQTYATQKQLLSNIKPSVSKLVILRYVI